MKPSSTFHGIVYSEKKKKQGAVELLHVDHFRHLQEGGRIPTKAEAVRFMEAFCSGNTRIRNKQFHAILSCKGKSISNDKLKTFGLEIMEKLGYGNTPVMIYGHNDTQHNHIHIVTTRIGNDGKKIPHHFERKRSNDILQQIMGTDYKKEVAQDIEDVLQYHCSTLAQYQLLFELKGYDTKLQDYQLDLFKYGTKQGNIPLESIEQKLKQSGGVNFSQVKALLFKYRKLYNTKLKVENRGKYTTAKPRLQSELTAFMRQRFGMEFIFFTSKNHQAPYGYVLIDHKNKSVFKGSDIMKLQDLLQEQENIKSQVTVHSQAQDETKGILSQETNITSTERQPSISIPLDKLINEIEKDVEQDLHKEEHTQKRKRGRFI